jgi:hypothetical protein
MEPDLYNFTVDVRTGPSESVSVPLGMHINVHEVVPPPPPPTTTGAGDQSLLNALIAMLAVVAVAMPLGLVYLRRQAAKRAPAQEVIIQTVEDANSGEYDPTRAAAPAAAAAAPTHKAPRAPRGAAASSAMTIVGVCKNCGGGVVDLGTGSGRCVSCGVEQIIRAGKR